MVINFLDDLNPEQRRAVTHPGGPVLILAGAGSGKTRCLTYRVAWLISDQLVDPSRILLLTFTNKAAGEMKSRVKTLLNNQQSIINNQQLPWAGTFHSWCAWILRKHAGLAGLKESWVIYDEDDKVSLLKDIISDLDLEHLSTDRTRTTSFGESVREPIKKDFRVLTVDVSVKVTPLIKRKIDSHPFAPFNQNERNKRAEEIFSIQSFGLAKRAEHSGIKKFVKNARRAFLGIRHKIFRWFKAREADAGRMVPAQKRAVVRRDIKHKIPLSEIQEGLCLPRNAVKLSGHARIHSGAIPIISRWATWTCSLPPASATRSAS